VKPAVIPVSVKITRTVGQSAMGQDNDLLPSALGSPFYRFFFPRIPKGMAGREFNHGRELRLLHFV
jgi:hypothetical protein